MRWQHQQRGGEPLPVDVYGSGEDMDAIKAKADANQLAITFSPGRDHLDDELHAYRQGPLLLQCSLPDR